MSKEEEAYTALKSIPQEAIDSEGFVWCVTCGVLYIIEQVNEYTNVVAGLTRDEHAKMMRHEVMLVGVHKLN